MNTSAINKNIILYFFLTSIVLGIIIYFPALKVGFLNWDDNVYITTNEMVTSPLHTQIVEIFSTTFEGHYHPFVLISLSLDHFISGGKAWSFHLTNILIHILNCVFVFILVRKLFRKDILAILVAVLFCVHPIHVESVAWITARKDVLFAFFFLLSLIQYLNYKSSGKAVYYILSLFLFLFSCLSKGQAVVFPLIILAVDYFNGRSLLSKKLIMEKIPFFMLSLFFGWLVIYAQEKTGYTSDVQPTIIDTLLFASYAFITYLQKIILPVGLCAYYPYPYGSDGGAHTSLWMYVAGMLIFLVLMYISYRKSKILFFAILFFFFNIILMLKFVPVANFIVAERYAYLASIGIILIFACLIIYLLEKYRKHKILIYTGFTLLVIVSGITAHQRSKTWSDSLTLLNSILDKHPGVVTALNSRGDVYASLGDFKSAERDFSKAIAIRPGTTRALRNRGMIYLRAGLARKALDDFNNVIKLEAGDPFTYLNRGIAYEMLNRTDDAMSDYSMAITLDSNASIAYNTRGILYSKTGDTQKARKDIDRAISLDPFNWQLYFNRGMTYLKDDMNLKALNDFNTCLNNGFDHHSVHLYRGIANYNIDNYVAATADFNAVVKKAPEVPEAYEYLGYIVSSKGDYPRAAEYFDYSLRLKPGNPHIYFERGLALVKSGNTTKGCSDLQAALRLGYENAADTISKYCN